MQQSSVNARAILVYGLIGLGVLALIIFGISWAKNRSQQFANQPQEQTSQNQNQSGENQNGQAEGDKPGEGKPDEQGTTATTGDQEVGTGRVSGAASTGPTQVPAAGASDGLVLAVAMAATAYAGARFVQSRKSINSLR